MAQWAKKRPDMHTSRLEWERSWQRDFDRNYPSTDVSRLANMHRMPKSTFSLANSDNVLFSIEHEASLICQLQHDIAKEAAKRFAQDDFEGAWKDLSADRRQEVVLEGIYRTMRIPDMEERRKWCPDSSLQNLTSRDGDEYLHVLKCLLPSDLDAPPAEPLHIPHTLVDRIFTPSREDLRHPGCKTFFRSLRNSRTYALSAIIWNILLTFVRFFMHSTHITHPPPPVWCRRGSAAHSTCQGNNATHRRRIKVHRTRDCQRAQRTAQEYTKRMLVLWLVRR